VKLGQLIDFCRLARYRVTVVRIHFTVFLTSLRSFQKSNSGVELSDIIVRVGKSYIVYGDAVLSTQFDLALAHTYQPAWYHCHACAMPRR